MPQRRDLVRDAPEAPDVGFEIVRLILAHLRAEVVGRARDGGREVVRALQDAADAEIAELHDAAAAEEDVLGLQVAVHDAEGVDVVQRERDLRDPVEDLALGEGPRELARVPNVREQVALLCVRGDDAEVLAPGIEEGFLVRDDVRVLELAQELRLRERLAALAHLVHGDLLRDVRPALAAVDDEVARAVVAVADDLAEVVLLHGGREARIRPSRPRRDPPGVEAAGRKIATRPGERQQRRRRVPTSARGRRAGRGARAGRAHREAATRVRAREGATADAATSRTPRRARRRGTSTDARRRVVAGPGEFRSQSTPIKRRDATRPRGEAAARARRV